MEKMSDKYFEATVVFVTQEETTRGKAIEKKQKEKYLVDGATPTVVEAKIYEDLTAKGERDFTVERIVESKIIRVF